MDPQRLVAHRGWQHRFPENTLAALGGAIDAGARHIEVDIQLSADGVPMLFHDERMERLCQHHGSIFDYTAEELQRFTVFEPERFAENEFDTTIGTLQQGVALISAHPHIHLYVEIKKQSIARFGREAVLDAVDDALAPVRRQVTLISFDTGILKLARQRGRERIGPVLSYWQQLKTRKIPALEPDCIFTNIRLVPRKEKLGDLPYRFVVYEVGDRESAAKWLARGAFQVETFLIGEFLSAPAAESGAPGSHHGL